ncbi:NAD6 NADH-ubiquinone oxidoreductase chain 6 [Candida maltosa Xu316]
MSIISGLSAILAVGLLSPVQSIVAMIILFVSVAITLYNTGFTLLGISYVLVYVGAIALLFLFILSLLNIQYTAAGGMNPLIIFLLLVCLVPFEIFSEPLGVVEIVQNNATEELLTVGSLFYTEYGIILLLIGVILILSVIGAICITR